MTSPVSSDMPFCPHPPPPSPYTAGSGEHLKLRVVRDFKEFLLASEQSFFAPPAGTCRTNTKFTLHYGRANADSFPQFRQLHKRGGLLTEHQTGDHF